MQSPTSHYVALKANVDHARKLVKGVDPLSCSSDLQHLKLRSYVLLCHSIIEEYVENLGRDVALEARKKFKSGSITKALVALVASRVLDEIKEKSRKKVSSDLVRNLDVFSEEAYTTYKNAVDSNHGIQPDDLLAIFAPIGFDPAEINLPLVNAMKALGEKRGALAHKFAITQQLTLSAFETDLQYIIDDLILLDEEACKCLAIEMAA